MKKIKIKIKNINNQKQCSSEHRSPPGVECWLWVCMCWCQGKGFPLTPRECAYKVLLWSVELQIKCHIGLPQRHHEVDFEKMQLHIFLGILEMCVLNCTQIATCFVHDLNYFVQNGALLQTSKANCSQSQWYMENQDNPSRSHDCRDTVQRIACILDKLCRNSVNTFFCRMWPHGGATTGLSEKCGLEDQSWPLMSVCTQFDQCAYKALH